MTLYQLGRYLRLERNRQKLPQDQLAKISGVSLNSIHSLETGKPVLTTTLHEVVQALGFTLTVKKAD